ncbi:MULTISPECIES: LysR substrate-binding domain-containing protein [Pseudomonas]|uniref:LysR substrate-binding domain-containing protein n=1 Tax=Pseudomonas TaxID=286 RepID=UPI0020A4E51B|nr:MULTISPECIES: LysR substrate-binding domain-containing protein [Pseudomonas]
MHPVDRLIDMSLSQLEIDHVRTFIAVAEAGSFTAAAETVGRSQSAVSQKIIRLEEILGLRVFERTSRTLTLTREGEQLLLNARKLMLHVDTFLSELKQPTRVKTLRLGISENLVPTQLPRLLSRFTQLHPDVQLELSTGLSHDLLAEHEAGQLDLVIAKQKAGNQAQHGRVIWREPLVWMAASDYVMEPAGTVRLVMMRPPCAYRAIMIDALTASRREWATACTANNLAGVQAAVAGGLGITALGASFIQPGMRILEPSTVLPALPSTEVAVIAQDPAMQHLVEQLISLLCEGLINRSALV